MILITGGSASVHAGIPLTPFPLGPGRPPPQTRQAPGPGRHPGQTRQAPLPPGPGRHTPPPQSRAYLEIRSTSGRYASYWNAILLPSATKLGQGYIFTGICDSFHRYPPPPEQAGRQAHTPPTRQAGRPPPPEKSILGDTVNEQAVCILLEYNLVGSVLISKDKRTGPVRLIVVNVHTHLMKNIKDYRQQRTILFMNICLFITLHRCVPTF